MKRGLFTLGAAIISFMLMAGVASAHQCYVASRSDQGNKSVAENSEAWQSFRSLAQEFLSEDLGLCDDGVDHVIDGLVDAGVDVDVLLHQRTTLAWNNENEQLFANGKGTEHFDWGLVEATAGPLIGQAFGICS